MNFKENWKRFWTLDRHHAAGFTLVELIVVIAILAILAAVAVPAYSGYVTQANITADEQLFSDIEQAIWLAYYSNPDKDYSGYITVSETGTDASSTDLKAALEAAFGSKWGNNALKYTEGWTSAAYMNSSFAGDEVELLETVDDLTTALQELIATNSSLVGERFDSFYSGLGISASDTASVADAAVLYVAQDSANLTTEQRTGAIQAMSNLNATTDPIGSLMPYFNNSVVAASAAYYAMFEAYCRYAGENGYTTAYTELTKAGFGEETNTAVIVKLTPMIEQVMDDDDAGIATYFNEYWGSERSKTDAAAYLDLMTTVNSAQSQVLKSGNIGSDNFFSNQNLVNLFQMVADGGAVVIVNEVDGNLIVTLPELN